MEYVKSYILKYQCNSNLGWQQYQALLAVLFAAVGPSLAQGMDFRHPGVEPESLLVLNKICTELVIGPIMEDNRTDQLLLD